MAGVPVTPNHTVHVGNSPCIALTWSSDTSLSCALQDVFHVGEYPVTVAVAGVRSPPFAALGLRCPPGYYGQHLEACTQCPEGGVCPGDVEEPYADVGYYPLGRASFVGCTPAQACLGGPNATCHRLYSGDRCASCAVGAYR